MNHQVLNATKAKIIGNVSTTNVQNTMQKLRERYPNGDVSRDVDGDIILWED